MNRRLITLLLTFPVLAATASAQSRTSYEELARTHRDPSWHSRSVALADSPDSMRVLTAFRIPHAALPFRRASGTDSMSVVVSVTFDYLSDEPARTRRRSSEPATSYGRTVWSSTITISSTDRSASDTLNVEGSADIRLPKHHIRVVPRIEFDGMPRSVAPSDPVRPSDAILFPIRPDERDLRLLNLGSNLRYGQAAHMAVILKSGSDSPRLRVYRMARSGKDSTLVEDLPMAPAGRFTGIESMRLGIGDGPGPVVYRALLTSATYENLTHRAYVVEGESILGRMEFLPRWYDMPIGLLNIDIAIDLMRFTLSRDELREFRRGSPSEREARFRQWWAERDPSPGGAFNELMAEYYGRIDHAYRSFTTPSKSGLESDMGRIWIRNGKPSSVERRFPPDGGTLEVWEYGNRRFIFRATSGFGDFELVSPH